ncbi:MAG: molybdopterin molybdotransferase MoeA [Pseudodesulfovibrio sp.]|nr:molybdopterin molybdotransferase MoeA [Pseudodesulfovibrio sp.]
MSDRNQPGEFNPKAVQDDPDATRQSGRFQHVESIASRSQAIRRLLKITSPLKAEQILPVNSVGSVAAQTIYASCNVPEQPSSVRDGYALQSRDIEKATTMKPVRLTVTQDVHAESRNPAPVVSGEAARVLTGGLVPSGADAVLAEEDVEISGETITVRTPVRPGWFVRPAGGEINLDATIAEAGTLITPQAAAVMIRTRVKTLQVHPKPRARVLALGSELSNPIDSEINHATGRFPADNLVLTRGLLEQCGADVSETDVLPDSENALLDILSQEGLPDIVITTGGTGRSERDFARLGARESGFTVLFDSVDIRPGRHMFAAHRDNTILFGLPGPPAAVFACFHAIILPVLRRLRGLPDQTEPLMARFAKGLSAKPGSEWMVQCSLEFKGSHIVATPLAGKDVPPMLGMSKAHGVAVLKSGDCILPDGEIEIISSIFNK